MLSEWDMSENIKTSEDALVYLQTAFEEGEAEDILEVLDAVARSKGLDDIAKQIGVSRECLGTSLSEKTNPSFADVYKLLEKMGLRLTVKNKAA
ncbi:MAG: putative addiction module antidote protein [Candidatus Riflebacteria bacterium]|nr:putative addiction module antidote protein [Candidatus Riflebacteria bacterium]